MFVSLIFLINKPSRKDTSIMLVEKCKLILSEMKIAITFSISFFSPLVQPLELFKWPEVLPNVPRLLMNYDRIVYIVIKYRNHPIIAKIKKEYVFIPYFSFHEVSVIDIKNYN